MRVRITNDKYYHFLNDVNLDCVFDAVNHGDGYAGISAEQLCSAGSHPWILENVEWRFSIDDLEILPEPCDITNKCCNQFGERDEMQAIINSLQADVIARDTRIAELEREVVRLERRYKELDALQRCVSRDA